MKELSLREVQLAELEILKQLSALCDKLSLRYCLAYGTLIGAARHKGFIPWDDDVDIMMPRPDYEKLISYMAAHENDLRPLKLMSIYNNPEYIYPIARLCDTRYEVHYHGAKDYGLGLFVDIYPFDGYGDSVEEAEKIFLAHRRPIQMIFQAGSDHFVKSTKGGWRTPFKFALYCGAKVTGAKRLIEKLELRAKKHPYDSCKLVSCTVWDSRRIFLPRDAFGEMAKLSFEDAEFTVPADYDRILTIIYGDYMKLPPESDRIGHHNYVAYRKEAAD